MFIIEPEKARSSSALKKQMYNGNFRQHSATFCRLVLRTVRLKRIATLCRGYVSTVRMISTAHFSVGKLVLHHYKRDLAHLSDFDSLVIGISKYER